MVEMTVFGLALDEESQMPLLILKDLGEKVVFPIWIGTMEAMAVSMVINNVRMPRPMTHDLFLNTIHELGAVPVAVEIVDIREGTFFAELVLKTESGEKRIDARPSDSVALALRADVPIRVHDAVLEQIQSRGETDYQAVVEGEEARKWAEVLADYDPDDAKYKM
ncbi:MAG TPA: bifunctional nuclease family protein [Desulfomicrobiaceae bacterium]|nr:bifunctional nuclease family protein [Desulfomicrobiaceae bacterium]